MHNFVSMNLQELCHQIEIPLYNVLELNEKDLTVRVEPMVTVGEITKYLIPKGSLTIDVLYHFSGLIVIPVIVMICQVIRLL